MSVIQEALKKAYDAHIKMVRGAHTQKETHATEAVEETTSTQSVASGTVVTQTTKHLNTTASLSMLIPAVVLVTIVVALMVRSFFTTTPSEKTKEMVRPRVESAADTHPISSEIQTTGSITASFKNSIPSNLITGPTPDLTLNGIMYLQEKPRAIINGVIVEKGDFIKGAKVTAINKDSVSLDFNNLEIDLKLQ